MNNLVNICIVHFNTPLLTECLVKSINKFTPNSKIYIFDNSDKFPFIYRQDNIVYLDNTKGQIINFENWLEQFPERTETSAFKNNYASAKHCYSIEKCIEIINEPFILLDSDILLTKDISEIISSSAIYSGETEIWKPLRPAKGIKKKATTRVKPYLLYINVNLCKKYDIHYYNQNYIYGLTIEGDYYDTGTYFYEQCSKLKSISHNSIKLNNYILHYKGGSWLEQAKKYDNYKNIDPDIWLKKNKKYWYTCQPKNVKQVIYTCITRGYDTLKENINLPNFDFICFTDNTNLYSETWIIKQIPDKLKILSPIKQQRYIKTHPHEFLSEYDISIWTDGSVDVLQDPTPLINDYCIEIPQHPKRNCLYEEAKECIRQKKDTPGNIHPQIEKYKKEGFPEKFGLPQSNIIIRKHNTPECIKLMEDWWKEIEQGSHRDQLSFSYVSWKNKNVDIFWLDKKIYNSKYFHWHPAHTREKDNRYNRTTYKYDISKSSKQIERPNKVHVESSWNPVMAIPEKVLINNMKPITKETKNKKDNVVHIKRLFY